MSKKQNEALFSHQQVCLENIACPICNSYDYKNITQSRDYDYFTTEISFSVVKCTSCELLYLNPRPKLLEIEKIYPEQYSAYHFNKIRHPVIRKARMIMQKGKVKSLLNCFSDNKKSLYIIDVGCGSSALLRLIRDCSRVEHKLFGNDFNTETLKEIEESGFIPLAGAFEKVSYQKESFDAIIMNQVIEHLFDVNGNINKSFELLKPNGVLFIETPSDEGLDAKLFRYNHWGGYHIPRHLQIFNESTLTFSLEKAGFIVDKVEYLPSPNFWTSSLRNMLFRAGFPYGITKRMNYKNLFFMTVFTALDLFTKIFHKTSNIRIIARKPNIHLK